MSGAAASKTGMAVVRRLPHVALLAAALAPSAAPAQAPPGPPTEASPAEASAPAWRLGEIEELALTHNPALARAAADLEAARGERLQAGLYPNPVVGVGQQQTGSRGLAEQDQVTFSQEIVLGGKLRLGRAAAEREVARLLHEAEVQRLRALTDARAGFFRVAAAQRERELTAELVRIADLGVGEAARRDAGTAVGENDVVEARIERHRAEIEFRRAVHRHAAAWRSLGAVVGRPDLPPGPVEADLGPLPAERTWEEVVRVSLRSSPELAASAAACEREAAGLSRAVAQRVPNVTVDAVYNWRDNGVGGRPDGGFLVSVPLPVWDRNQGGIAQARARAASAAHASRQAELDLTNRLALAFERYENARFEVTQYRDVLLPQSARALELTRANFAAGAADYNDLLTSQRTYAQASLAHLAAVRELLVADAELEGMALTGSLGGAAE